MNEHLERALDCFGGKQTSLAKALGVSQPYIHKILKTGHVPAIQCRNIERATKGKVTAEQLRPDIFAPIDSVA